MAKKPAKKPKQFVPSKNLSYKRLGLVSIVLFAVVGSYFLLRANAAPRSQPAVTLYVTPQSQQLRVNEMLTATVRLNTNGQSVIATQANLSYPSDKLEFVSIDGAGGAFEIQAENTGGGGSIHMARGSFNPINSPDALIGKVTFKAIRTGRHINVNFSSESIVARADDGVNILAKTTGGQYTVK
jgi:hypothetical protein